MTGSRPPNPRPARDRDDAVLASAFDAWRRDVAGVRPAPHLAERVLAAAARGEVESSRFRRLARVYAVAASVLAAAGVAGALLARAPVREVAASRPPSVHALEEARLTRVGLDSVSRLTVDGR